MKKQLFSLKKKKRFLVPPPKELNRGWHSFLALANYVASFMSYTKETYKIILMDLYEISGFGMQ